MRLRVGAATDTGRVRKLNEDVYMIRAEQGLFVVCDGMGGGPAGEIASQIAVDAIFEELKGDVREIAGSSSRDDNGYLPRTSRLASAVRRSNEVVYNHGLTDPRHTGMATTVVGAWIRRHVASVAHVGDSRAYLWHNGHLEPLTRDHSLLETYVREGVLDPEKSMPSPELNVLVRVLGREPDVDVEVNEVPVRRGDYLLLCSDGLTRMMSEPMLAQAIGEWRDPQRICDQLIDAANSLGGADNITVVVVEVRGRWSWCIPNQWRRRSGGGRNAENHSAV
jgi:serine/threonine protein phosphatase PrpC